MPELAEVETKKTAGLVNPNRPTPLEDKIKKEEEELEALMKARTEEVEQKVEEPEAKPEKEELSGEERTYKKRYSDLRSHLNKQAEELKELKAQLENAQKTGKVRAPTSDESIDAWAKKYPEIAGIVETIAEKKAQEKFKYADERLQQIDKINADAQRTKAENEIRAMHGDFDDLRGSDDFHDWAAEQPKWVQDALYENQDDPQSVIRVIDLYKVDKGMDTRGKRQSTRDAASAVRTKRTSKPDNDNPAGHLRESTVQRMSAEEYESRSDEIMESIRSGKFIYDVSGGAR
jgi:Skp family chaperone for outer membrane proteins